MTKEWYISFHGGDEPTTLNNIHVYSTDGKWLRKALNKDSLPKTVELRELRGFTIGPDRNLYVVNAFKDYSQILRFRGALNKQDQHDFSDVFVQHDATSNPGLVHPFNAAFDPQGNLCVTSQETSVALRYHGPKSRDATPGSPMEFPSALRGMPTGGLYPGTFCASAKQEPRGLVVVREAVFIAGLLYVADRDADCVKKYDPISGEHKGEIVAKGLIDKPIHLAVSGSDLYIGSRGNESVSKCNLQTGAVTPFIQPRAGGLKNPAGMAFGNDGFLHIASRGSRQVLRYRIDGALPDKKPFIDDLKDDPEFIELMSRP